MLAVMKARRDRGRARGAQVAVMAQGWGASLNSARPGRAQASEVSFLPLRSTTALACLRVLQHELKSYNCLQLVLVRVY